MLVLKNPTPLPLPSTELDSMQAAKLFRTQESRIMRVARGAGVSRMEVEVVLVQYKKFADLVKEMGSVKVWVGEGGRKMCQSHPPCRIC